VALRVLRLIFVASIFAFVLTVRTVAPIHANSGDPVGDATPELVELSELGEEPPIEPTPPPDPPTEPPPVEPEPPPADPVEPPPTDPPPADTTEVIEPPPEPPVEAEPPAVDAIEPAPTDPPPASTTEVVEPPTEPPVEAVPPPADPVEPAPNDPPPADPPPADTVETVPPPPDPPIEEELPPVDAIEPAPTDPPVSDLIVPPLTDPSAVIDDPAVSDRSANKAAPSVPSTHGSPVPFLPVADNPAQAATEPVAAIVSTQTRRMESVEPDHHMAFAPAIAAGAGLAAGIALTNHAPSSVAVAIEFGRAGGGWAGALVFNLWLRRQMRERRMSQRRLAGLAGVDHSTISRLLRQDRRPSLTTATKLARALKQVPGDQAEPETADYFERIPEETVFPARRVELALRADELLDDEQVRRVMNIYLDARRRNQASAPSGSAGSRAAPARAAPDSRR